MTSANSGRCLFRSLTPPAADIAANTGGIRRMLEEHRKSIGPLDLLIAAHALSRDLTVITSNEKEFKHVENLKAKNLAKSTFL